MSGDRIRAHEIASVQPNGILSHAPPGQRVSNVGGGGRQGPRHALAVGRDDDVRLIGELRRRRGKPERCTLSADPPGKGAAPPGPRSLLRRELPRCPRRAALSRDRPVRLLAKKHPDGILEHEEPPPSGNIGRRPISRTSRAGGPACRAPLPGGAPRVAARRSRLAAARGRRSPVPPADEPSLPAAAPDPPSMEPASATPACPAVLPQDNKASRASAHSQSRERLDAARGASSMARCYCGTPDRAIRSCAWCPFGMTPYRQSTYSTDHVKNRPHPATAAADAQVPS